MRHCHNKRILSGRFLTGWDAFFVHILFFSQVLIQPQKKGECYLLLILL